MKSVYLFGLITMFYLTVTFSMMIQNVGEYNGLQCKRVVFQSKYHPGFPLCYIVLPKAYQTEPARRFPVIFNMHGQGASTHEDILKKGVFGNIIWTRDLAYLEDIKEQPTILVALNGNMNDGGNCFYTGNINISDGKGYSFELYLTRELIDSIDANFRTIACRRGRAICGFSMGGYGSAHLAQAFPDLFACGVAYAGAFDWLGSRIHSARAINFKTIPYMINEFEFGMLWSNAQKFHTLLDSLNVPHGTFFPPTPRTGRHTSYIIRDPESLHPNGIMRQEGMDFIDSCFRNIKDYPEAWNYIRV